MLTPLLMTVGLAFALALAGGVEAKQSSEVEMTWNGAPYRCHGFIGGQIDDKAPSWEQQIPVFVEFRSVPGIDDRSYTCLYEQMPAVAPEVSDGQLLAEALV